MHSVIDPFVAQIFSISNQNGEIKCVSNIIKGPKIHFYQIHGLDPFDDGCHLSRHHSTLVLMMVLSEHRPIEG